MDLRMDLFGHDQTAWQFELCCPGNHVGEQIFGQIGGLLFRPREFKPEARGVKGDESGI